MSISVGQSSRNIFLQSTMWVAAVYLSFFPGLTGAEETIRFGILSIAQPARIHAKWQPFVDYMQTQLGQPVEIVIPRGFGKMKAAVVEGRVDFFYVNSHVFYRLKQRGHAVGVGQMQNIDGKITSRSEIFARADSGITNVKQLKGKSIAFVSPMGAGGYLAPRAYLYKKGIKTKTQSKEVFTKNLSNSIHKVLLGDINAGTMCGVNYRLMGQKIDTGELKVIGISDDYPENVIGARKNLDSGTIKQFRKNLTAMEHNKQGMVVLAGMHSMKIKRFLPYDAASERVTKRLLRQGEF